MEGSQLPSHFFFPEGAWVVTQFAYISTQINKCFRKQGEHRVLSVWAFETLFQLVTWLCVYARAHVCMNTSTCLSGCALTGITAAHADTHNSLLFLLCLSIHHTLPFSPLPSVSAHLSEPLYQASTLPALKTWSLQPPWRSLGSPLAPGRVA